MLLAPKNIAFPFLYVVDFLKDSIQLIMLIVAVGGPVLVFNNWTSFTSVVSWLNNSIVGFIPVIGLKVQFKSFLGNLVYTFFNCVAYSNSWFHK